MGQSGSCGKSEKGAYAKAEAEKLFAVHHEKFSFFRVDNAFFRKNAFDFLFVGIVELLGLKNVLSLDFDGMPRPRIEKNHVGNFGDFEDEGGVFSHGSFDKDVPFGVENFHAYPRCGGPVGKASFTCGGAVHVVVARTERGMGERGGAENHHSQSENQGKTFGKV